MQGKKYTTGVALMAIAAVLAPQSVMAQQAQAAENVGVGEIVVTARKTAENLQTTPVAVTALSSETLEKAQIRDVAQVQQMVPNISFGAATAQPGSATIGLRGLTSSDGLMTLDQAVGVYFDGVYLARSSGALLNLLDVERFEVLRGPQGTLFGRNTTGGALNIVSKQPTGEFEGSLKLRYGNYDAKELTGVLNLPIMGEQIAARFAYQHTDHNGYATNLLDGSKIGSDNTDFVRGTVRIAPEGLPAKLTIAGDFTDRKTSGQISALIGLSRNNPISGAAYPAFLLPGRCATLAGNPGCLVSIPGDDLGNYLTGDPFKFTTTPGLYGNVRNWGVSGTLDVELGENVDFKSITAWRDLETHSLSDQDGTPYNITNGIVNVNVTLPGLPTLTQGNHIWQSQFSQELQLSGKAFDNRMTWILGGFYFRETGTDLSLSASNQPNAAVASQVTNANWGDVENISSAGYAQLTYEVIDGVRLTGGARYTKDTRSLISRNGRVANYGAGAFSCTVAARLLEDPVNCRSFDQRSKYDYWSYTFGPDWQVTPDLFIYAKTSRAFRAGGWNLRSVIAGARNDFDPEKVTDYEIGAKIDLLDRKLRINLAAFHADYTDIQRSIQAVVGNPPTLSSIVTNAASAKIDGIEVEVVAAPTPELRLTATYGYLNARHTNYFDQATPPNDLTLTPFAAAPKNTFSASFDYTLPVNQGMEFVLHGDFYFKDDQFGVAPPPATGFRDKALMKGYEIVNATATLRLVEVGLDIQAYISNLFDKRYFTRLTSQEHSLGYTGATPGDPRTYGVSVSYKF